MAHASNRYPVPETAGGLARRTTAGVGVAVLLLLVAQAVVDTVGVDLGASGPMSPFAAAPLVGTTIVAGIGAAIAYAVLVRSTDQPVRNFVGLAAVVFGVMLVPVIVFTPSLGVTPAGQGVLVLYHLLVAVPLVGFIIGAVEL